MIKRLLCLALALVMALGGVGTGWAKNGEQHDTDIKQVLLGIGSRTDRKKALEAIQWAVYFATDCWGRRGTNDSDGLDALRDFGVKNVPGSIDDFKYRKSDGTEVTKYINSNHEIPTHMGWDYDYKKGNDKDDIAKWADMRKPLLVSTVTQVFTYNHSFFERFFMDIFSYPDKDKFNSFSALVYYVHLLGDIEHNEKSTAHGRMLFSGKVYFIKKTDLIDDLLKHLGILFIDQSMESNYSNLIKEIDKIRKATPKNVGNDTSDEEYSTNKSQAEELLTTLKKYVPKLLEKETFFKKVFYPDEM